MTNRSRARTFLVFLAMTVAACGTPEPVSGGSSDNSGLDGEWVLASGSVDGTPLELNPEWRVTMTINGSEIGGRAACNHYGGSVSIDGGEFSVDDVFQTEMGCEPDIMALESAFLSGLFRVTSAARSGDVATLLGEDVEYAFTLVPPIAPSDFVGTTWVLNTIIQGEVASSTFAGAAEATLRFDEGGTFTGGTGCRSISGEYLITGDTVQLTSWGAEGECDPKLADQDGQVIAVLEDGFTIEIAEDRMTITASGGEGLSYRTQP